MGQRSQIYIRYKNEKNLVGMHLQWNYGHYMINRAYQLLDFISKNLSDDFSHFQERTFDVANLGHRYDLEILHSLIQINTTIGSYVKGIDLIKEEYEWDDRMIKETFKMTPANQDNNNGILVIDIRPDGKIKYGFGGGIEEVDSMQLGDDFKMINATDYFGLSEQAKSEEYKLSKVDKELYETVLNQVAYIDSNFELLTDKEYKEIFDKEYRYEDCLECIK